MQTNFWTYKTGMLLGAGLALTGVLLQLALGGVNWTLLAWPVNLVVLVLYLTVLAVVHLFRHRVRFFRWLGTAQSAVCALAWAAVLTVVMGLTRQYPSDPTGQDVLGLHRMLSARYFVLIYCWLVSALGLTLLRCCIPLSIKRIPFLLNHLGLFVALLCGALGSADMQRLRMQVEAGRTESAAADRYGRMHALPLSIELKAFTLTEYPPELLLVNHLTGMSLPQGMPERMVLEDGVVEGSLCGWNVRIVEALPYAVPSYESDTVCYIVSHDTGACTAVHVAASKAGGPAVSGWVSCGSYAFPPAVLRLNGEVSLFMPARTPRRFTSSVRAAARGGKSFDGTVEVNRPCRAAGWKIYQFDYDADKGRWSEWSVFELVRDPWMPGVYAGIWMMMAGAVCMSVSFGKSRIV